MKISKYTTAALAGALSLAGADTIAELEQRIAALESQQSSVDGAYMGGGGLNWSDKTSVGGYGELHYNIGLDAGSDDKLDFHRWVLFVNHEFSDKIKMFSELEIEHSFISSSSGGAVELEQAYIEFDLDEQVSGLKAKAGLFLTPLGILNETHEPNTFYGVERNNVEKYVIPTTWWEGGAGVTKTTDNGFQFDLNLTSALNISDSYVRGGREKVENHANPELATTGRVRYTGFEGLELVAGGQYTASSDGDLSGLLLTTHAVYQKGGFQLKALYAGWSFSGGANNPNQQGFYIEPSYRFETAAGDLGVFARYGSMDAQTSSTANTDQEEYSFGVNYWPHENVVLKADVNIAEPNGGDRSSTANLGLGYQF